MGVIKDKIISHMKENNFFHEMQAGSSPGRRTADDFLILQYFEYCINKTFKHKSKLYVISRYRLCKSIRLSQ